MSDPIKFPINKVYKDFGNLLVDTAKEKSHIKSGIIIIFDEEEGIQILPCCTEHECAYAAANLLKFAAE